MELLVHYLSHYNLEKYGPLAYAREHDAGFDLRAATSDPICLNPGEIVVIPNGFCVAIPQGYEMQVRSRSGLSVKGVIVANAPGTVDSGYRGEVKTILTNISSAPHVVQPGDRIAQAVLSEVARMSFVPVKSLPESERGEGGFGSTGVS